MAAPLHQEDELEIRQLRHAYRASRKLASEHAQLDEVLTAAHRAGERLWRAALALVEEEADDPPVRAARNDAARELRHAAIGILRRFSSRVLLAATNELGEVVDSDLQERSTRIVQRFLPTRGYARIREHGQELLTDVNDLVAELESFDSMAAALPSLQERMLAYRSAIGAVERERDELAGARRKTDEARAEAQRLGAAARDYVSFLSKWSPNLGVDPLELFPVPHLPLTVPEILVELDAHGVDLLPPDGPDRDGEPSGGGLFD